MSDLLGQTGAKFSDCRRYRYCLWRVWDATLPRALFILMNPSDANEIENDPTVERQHRRAMRWASEGWLNVGGVEIVNAFALIETYSDRLLELHLQGTDLVGPENDAAIVAAAKNAAIVICGWGQPGMIGGRGDALMALLRDAGIKLYALKINKDGTPAHPLYLAYALKPQEFK